jgi:hypothetical protein
VATKTTYERLAAVERRYRTLAAELAEIGYIASGSLASRYNSCGKPNCACHGDPPAKHGPYWHFTAKVGGKTVNRRLSEREAAAYSEWIANDRRLRALVEELRAVAHEAIELILADLAETGPPDASPRRPLSSAESRGRQS